MDGKTFVSEYSQFCPIAKAMELLDERWTILILRELLSGSQHFNQILSGNPKMSSALLAKRLRMLVRYELVDRREDGNRVVYTLTPAGLELRPIIEAIGVWGTRWAADLGDNDLDPQVLLWDVHYNIDHDALPVGRTVVQFVFPEVEPGLRDWWLVLTADEADVCDVDPGYDVDVTVNADLRALTAVWMGDLGWPDVLRDGRVSIDGSETLRRAFPTWLKLSMFAGVPRVAAPA
ncbi:MAG TPA: helix-turn-helix domain-containing protein [Nitriliruptorales bacterium]